MLLVISKENILQGMINKYHLKIEIIRDIEYQLTS